MPSSNNKIPIWLDCDPGHDDAFALLLTLHHPSLQLLGLSTVHGNASLAQTTTNALRLLTALGHPRIPVYPGCSRPFSRNPIHAADIHGTSGLDGTDLLPLAAAAATAVPTQEGDWLLAMRDAILSQPKDEVWIVGTGTWTNIALLFAAFPDLADHVRGVSLMGGAIGSGFSNARMARWEDGQWKERIGNTTHWAEFNVYCDPESARSLLRHPTLQGKLILIPLDITHLAIATTEVQARLLHGDGGGSSSRSTETRGIHPLRQMFHDLLSFFAATYRDVFGFSDGPPMHDPLAVAVVLDTVGIEDFGFEYGKHAGKHAGKGDEVKEEWIIDVITDGQHISSSSSSSSSSTTSSLISSEHEAGQTSEQDTIKGKQQSTQLGRTILVRPATTPGEKGVRIPGRIQNLARFWEVLDSALDSAQAATAVTSSSSSSFTGNTGTRGHGNTILTNQENAGKG